MPDTKLLADVAKQVFDGLEEIETPSGTAKVSTTPKLGLKRVEFAAGDQRLVGIEQNPNTLSRWAQLARAGHRVMQFRDARTGAYIANVVDGKVTLYRKEK